MIGRLTRRGFVGPRFQGVTGVLRFAYQELIGRTEVVLVAEPDTFRPEREPLPDLELRFIRSWKEFAPNLPAFAEAYHRGYGEDWKEVFEWGEELVLASRQGHVVGFGWLQRGADAGVRCHYRQIQPGEYRVLRVGVFPSFRGSGINTSFYVLLLRELFLRGARRAYIDSSKDNLPSIRAQVRAGFRPIAEIYVPGRLRGGREVTWMNVAEIP